MLIGDDLVVLEKINNLKNKLEKQVIEKDSYENIYETSVAIDKLLVEYYKGENKLLEDFKNIK